MTKLKAKPSRPSSRAKAAVAKTSEAKRSPSKPANGAATLIVMGFDDQQKPRGARFENDNLDLVTKAAELMGLRVYKTSNSELAAIAKKLPVGRLYANGRGFVPNVRQSLYSDLVAALAFNPEALVSNANEDDNATRLMPANSAVSATESYSSNGSPSRHGGAGLAARQHRRTDQALRATLTPRVQIKHPKSIFTYSLSRLDILLRIVRSGARNAHAGSSHLRHLILNFRAARLENRR